jgi:hypothetical protein
MIDNAFAKNRRINLQQMVSSRRSRFPDIALGRQKNRRGGIKP